MVGKRHRGGLVQQRADPVQHSVRLLVGQVQVHRETPMQARSQPSVAVSTRSLDQIASLSVRYPFILKPGRDESIWPNAPIDEPRQTGRCGMEHAI